jgi:hypothetical protein
MAAKKDQPGGGPKPSTGLVKDTLLEEPKHSARWRKGHGVSEQVQSRPGPKPRPRGMRYAAAALAAGTDAIVFRIWEAIW